MEMSYQEKVKMDPQKRFLDKTAQNDILNLKMPESGIYLSSSLWSTQTRKKQKSLWYRFEVSTDLLNDKVLPVPDLLQKLVGTLFSFWEGAFST